MELNRTEHRTEAYTVFQLGAIAQQPYMYIGMYIEAFQCMLTYDTSDFLINSNLRNINCCHHLFKPDQPGHQTPTSAIKRRKWQNRCNIRSAITPYCCCPCCCCCCYLCCPHCYCCCCFCCPCCCCRSFQPLLLPHLPLLLPF